MTHGKRLSIVIIGCGRFGSYLAAGFSRVGHKVLVVDARDAAFAELPPDYEGGMLEGDAATLGVLREAGLEHADVLVAATANDNVNMMVAQIAKKIFRVERVLARLWDLDRREVCARLAIEAVFPTAVVGELALGMVDARACRDADGAVCPPGEAEGGA